MQEKVVRELHGMLETLEVRLLPVLPGRPTAGNVKESAPSPIPSLAVQIQDNTKAVGCACARINDILQRLEL